MQESCYRRVGGSQDFRGARVGMKELDVRFQSPPLVLAFQRVSAFSLLTSSSPCSAGAGGCQWVLMGPEELCLRKRKWRILPAQGKRKQLEPLLYSPVLRRPPQPSQELRWKITIGQAAATLPVLGTELCRPQPLALSPTLECGAEDTMAGFWVVSS